MADQTTFDYLQQEGDTSFQLHNEDVDEQGPTPTHIVFLIHGMGYKMFEKGKFRSNMLSLSKTMCSSLFSDYQDSGIHLYFYPIEWAADFHGMDTVDNRLKRVTLPTIPGMRVFNNDCLADVLFYFTEYHRQRLFNKLGEKINNGYQKLMNKFPDFEGQAGIIGHSLGGVIGYDLLVKPNPPAHKSDTLYHMAFPSLERPTLQFEPSFLFVLGCPVSAVMIMRGLQYEHYQLPESIMFKNIFNPYDPLAYRFEPFMDTAYEGIEPVPLPATQPSQGIFPTLQSYLPRPPSALSDISFIDSAKSMFTNFNSVKEASPPPQSPPFSPDAEFDIPPMDIPNKDGHKRSASLVSLMGFNELRRSSLSSSPKMPSFLNSNQEPENISDNKRLNTNQAQDPINKNNTTSPLAKLAIQNSTNNDGSGNESDDEASNPDMDTFSQSLPSNLDSKFKSFPETRSRVASMKESMSETISKSSLGQWVESARQLLTTKAEDEQLSWVLGGLTLGLGMFSTKNTIENNLDPTNHHEEDEVTQAFKHSSTPQSSDSVKVNDETKQNTTDLPRYDHVIQVQSMQNLRLEYLLGIRAHFCYWSDRDVSHFILGCLKELKEHQIKASL